MSTYGKGWRDVAIDRAGRIVRADATPAKAARTSKYGNVRAAVHPETLRVYDADPNTPDGWRTFDSRREANRYVELALMLRDGTIAGLQLQTRFALTVTGTDGIRREVGCYLADFTYTRDGRPVVEDAKGHRTELYRWKRRHMLYEHGIDVLET